MKTTRISFEEKNGYKAVVEFLNDGYAEHLVPALWEAVTRLLPSMLRDGEVPGEGVLNEYWALCELLRCVVRDEYGLDLLEPGPSPNAPQPNAPRPNAPQPPEGGGGSSQPVEELAIDNC